MTALTWVLLAFAVIGLLFGLWQWTARRRTVQRLDNMLEQSISSGFTEEHFDETELSALETKFARFLRGSAHTQKTMKTEQEAVKTLISDISHQTRTPIANLLVYASLLTESDLSPRQREQVQALLTQGEKLSFLIQTLVKASRLETGIVVPTPTLGPVAPLLEATVEQERPAAEKKKITLQNIDAEHPENEYTNVYADFTALDKRSPWQCCKQRGKVHTRWRKGYRICTDARNLLPGGRDGYGPRYSRRRTGRDF